MSDEEEVINPQIAISEECHEHCTKQWAEYEACAKRIEGDDSGEKNCAAWYMDYWHCNDECVRDEMTFLICLCGVYGRDVGCS